MVIRRWLVLVPLIAACGGSAPASGTAATAAPAVPSAAASPAASPTVAGFRDGKCVQSALVPGTGRVGGKLAVRTGDLPLLTTAASDLVWLKRSNGEPLRLQGLLLDGLGTLVLVLTASDRVDAGPGWSDARGYKSAFKFETAGCWQVRDMDGAPDDAVVLLVGPIREPGLAVTVGEGELLRSFGAAGFIVTEIRGSTIASQLAGAEGRWFGVWPAGGVEAARFKSVEGASACVDQSSYGDDWVLALAVNGGQIVARANGAGAKASFFLMGPATLVWTSDPAVADRLARARATRAVPCSP